MEHRRSRVAWMLPNTMVNSGPSTDAAGASSRKKWAKCLCPDDDTPPVGVVYLLDRLRAAGPEEQVSRLLARNPADHVALGNPDMVFYLLDQMREAGADQQAAALAERAAAPAVLRSSSAVESLLEYLREAGADQEAATLAARLPAAGMFDLFQEYTGTRYCDLPR